MDIRPAGVSLLPCCCKLAAARRYCGLIQADGGGLMEDVDRRRENVPVASKFGSFLPNVGN